MWGFMFLLSISITLFQFGRVCSPKNWGWSRLVLNISSEFSYEFSCKGGSFGQCRISVDAALASGELALLVHWTGESKLWRTCVISTNWGLGVILGRRRHYKDFMHGSYSSSLSLHGVRVDDEHSDLDNSSRPSSPFDILTSQDVLPIEMGRSKFLDIIVDHFIGEHVIEVAEPSGLDCVRTNDKLNKRTKQEVRYEGDPRFALPLMYIANLYETLVGDVNVRLASLIESREKTIGMALEAAGGLYRKLTQKFPKKGACSFRRRELATSHATRTQFPELVVQEEKRVRFVVINGLVIIERPNNMRMEDAEWFKRLTGRNEVAVSSRDYKFYSPRHKCRRTTQPVFDTPGTTVLSEDANSPLACSSGFRPPNEMQNQHQSSSKQHIEQIENQPYLHFLDQAKNDTIQQNQHSSQFLPIHACTAASHLSDNPQQHQSYLSQHLACTQAGHGHLGGRMNILPTSPAKFCDECGSPYLRATSKFCSECGTKRLGI